MNCPKCGKELIDDEVFCPYCDYEINGREESTPVKKEYGPAPNNHINLLLIVSFIVLVVVVLINFHFGKGF